MNDKSKKKMDEVLASIDSIVNLLNHIPESMDLSLKNPGVSRSINPLTMLMELLNHTCGYNKVIEIISKFLTYEVEALEYAVKAILIANIKGLISCSINPFITDDLLHDGIVFNLNEVDIWGMLNISPFDKKKGSLYYFGVDVNDKDNVVNSVEDIRKMCVRDLSIPDKKDKKKEKRKKRDFNLVLWYMKTMGGRDRLVWNQTIQPNDKRTPCEKEGCKVVGEGDDEHWELTYDSSKARHYIELEAACKALRRYLSRTRTMDKEADAYSAYNEGKKTDDASFTSETFAKNNPIFYHIINDYQKATATAEDPESWIIQLNQYVSTYDSTIKPKLKAMKKAIKDETKKAKQKKCDGTLTLEYADRANELRAADHSGMLIQTPYNNSIHIFPGNTACVRDKSYDAILEEKEYMYNKLAEKQKEIEGFEERLRVCLANIENLPKQFASQKPPMTEDQYKTRNMALQGQKNKLQQNINDAKNELTTREQDLAVNTKKMDSFLNSEYALYRSIYQNYYYRHTLLEFNYDYVASLDLFDSKTMTARIIDAICGLGTMTLDLSLRKNVLMSEIETIVERVIVDDTAEISDCFFSFNNDEYNDMLERAELRRMRLYSRKGEASNTEPINADALLENLNSLDSSASKETIQSTINTTLTDFSKEIAKGDPKKSTSYKLNVSVSADFITNLIKALVSVVAYAILSPKVYLLLLVNQKIVGGDNNFTFDQYMATMKKMFITIIRSVRDALMKYIVEQVIEIVRDLSVTAATRFAVESYNYYARLLRKCIECVQRFKGKYGDWTMDNVGYADIIESESEYNEENC